MKLRCADLLLCLSLAYWAGSAGYCGDKLTSSKPAFGKIVPSKETLVWKLVQWDVLTGDWNIYLGRTGFRAENARAHMVVVATPPEWRPTVFNPNTMAAWQNKRDQLYVNDMAQGFALMAGLPNIAAIPVKPSGSTQTIRGFVCKTFVTDAEYTARQKELLLNKEVGPQHPRSATISATNLPSTEEERFIMARLLGMPNVHLIPIKMDFVKLNDGEREVLKTNQASQVEPPKDWLKLPDNPKWVKRVSDVRLDDTVQGGMDLMLDAMPTSEKKRK